MAERAKRDSIHRNNGVKHSAVRRTSTVRPSGGRAAINDPINGRLEKLQLLQSSLGNHAVQRLWKAGALQTSLKVGAPDDKYEKQADAVAKQVVDGPAPTARKANAGAQRTPGAMRHAASDEISMKPIEISRLASSSSGKGAFTADSSVSSSINGLKTNGGRPLPQSERAYLEPRMGYDLGHVRIHTGESAEKAADSIQAKAFTIGNHVAFNKDQYKPGTTEGRRLIAHEATHTIQQGGGRSMSVAQRMPVQRQSGTEKKELSASEKVDRLVSTIKESYKYIPEILGDVWEHIKEHWVLFISTILAFLLAQVVIGILAGIPEPTLLTKVVAVGLQVLLLGILGYFAAVETAAATREGQRWWRLATDPNATKEELTEASRAFLLMVLHMSLVVLAVAGVRVRTRIKFVKDTIKKPTRPMFQKGSTKTKSSKSKKSEKGREKEPSAGIRLPSVPELLRMTADDIVGPNPKFVPSQGIASAEIIVALAREMVRGNLSMLKKGIRVNPPDGGIGPWVIVDGTHRFMAARLAGIKITEQMLIRGRSARPPWKWSQVKWPLKELKKYGL